MGADHQGDKTTRDTFPGAAGGPPREPPRDVDTMLQGLLELSPDAVVMADGEGRIVRLNAHAEAMFGYREDELVGQPVEVLVPERLRQRHREHRAGYASTPYPRPMGTGLGLYGRRKDGSEFPVDIMLRPLPTAQGFVVVSIIRDMSERQRMEDALRESEERFRRLVELAPAGIAVHRDGKFLYVNPAGARLLGATEPEELIGKEILDVVHPDSLEVAEARLRQLREQRGPVALTGERLVRRDGTTVEAEITAVPVVYEGQPAMLVVGRDVTERKLLEAQLVYLAHHDALTGLFNRRRFEEEVQRQLAQARRFGTQGALLWLDLDRFREVNDSLGHRAGDVLLASLASLLRGRLRETDILARLGSDEFAILMPHTSAEGAQATAARILEAIRHHSIIIAGQPIGVTASIGIVLFPAGGTTAEELLAHADLAMHQAKEEGRNRFCVYDPHRDWQAQAGSRVVWANRIREALDQDRFLLYAQPILDLKGGQIAQHELLLRMVGGGSEIIPPRLFLDIAERYSLMNDIDRWVIRQAVGLIAQQRRAGRGLCLAVNISGSAFRDNELLALIERHLAEAAVDPACLVLEITENAAIANIHQAQQFISALTGLGCRFALDDFGVGFSSFYYLKHLPVEYLKIDGSFIRNLPHDPMNQQLVQAMVQVAHSLGKKTVAEHVEDAETLKLLRHYGVDYAQGYHIGRPMPLVEVLQSEPVK